MNIIVVIVSFLVHPEESVVQFQYATKESIRRPRRGAERYAIAIIAPFPMIEEVTLREYPSYERDH
jgi:hypothetical protein